MTPEQWARVSELLETAVALPPGQREPWLDRACDDDVVAASVRELLAAYERDPDYLERQADPRGAVDQADHDVLAGRRVGAYRLTREIGRGGMGVVYEAVRDDETFDRRAAVKMLPAWSAAVLAERFRFERRVLAGLDHPGIARLIDAGATDEGAPFCVMEFVDGQPIDAWCEARHLDLADRARLLVRVSEAVAYAHGHLVVHRDLKPSNILVTADGQPKLLDFGIATLLDDERGLSIGTTRTGFTSFTPEFASPEQVRGEKVTIGTDVYSLGVLLYLLLAGRRPYDLRGLAPIEALRVVCEVDPPRPSSVAPAPLAARLAGDLDTIVMKALRKAPADRYATVGDLAADLRAWLDHRPIAAAPASWMYRTRRFVRRHAVAVAAATAASLAVVGGAAATAWQARVARQERALADARFRDVRQLANAVVGPLYDAIAKVPGSTEARQVLVKEALTYLDRLSAQAGDDLDLTRELAEAYEKIGDVQGSPFGPNLGDRDAAAASYARLASLRTAVLARRPDDAAARLGMAEADRRLGDLAFGRNQFDEALAAYRRATDRLQPFAAPGATDAVLALARVHDRIGNTLARQARYADAAAAFERALALVRPLADGPDAPPAARRFLMASLGNSGDVPYYQGRYAEALARYDEARAIARQAAESAADPAGAKRDLQLTTTRSVYALIALGRLDEAAALEREAVRLLSDLVTLDPRATSRRFELAQARRGVAVRELQLRRYDDARREVREALAVFDAAFSLVSAPDQRFPYALTLATLADVELALGRRAEAAAAFRRSLAVAAEAGVDVRQPAELHRIQWELGKLLAGGAAGGDAVSRRREAGELFERARDGFLSLERQGALPERYRDAPRALTASIAALDRG